MKLNIKSKKGFTLIELLVVIGILAVLAAIAIPSVAGLIDRANVSADKTNSNEMTNAVERFTSEYELYCQDIASGALDEDNLDSAQGRVKNVIGVTTRAGIEGIEYAQGATIDDNVIAIYRDTKYPANAKTMQLVVQNYTKTSSSTFEPKQSDMHYWYSPDCGVVVVAEPNKTAAELDKYVISGMDAKGNDITSDSVNAQWIDVTLGVFTNNSVAPPAQQITFTIAGTQYYAEEGMTWTQWVESDYNNDDFYHISDGRVKGSNGIPTDAVAINGTSVSPTDVIQNGFAYKYGSTDPV